MTGACDREDRCGVAGDVAGDCCGVVPREDRWGVVPREYRGKLRPEGNIPVCWNPVQAECAKS